MSGSKLLDDSSLHTAPEVCAGLPGVQVDQPLGLTVHSMPEPAQAIDLRAGRAASGRWKMLAVLLVCAAPVVASYFTYYVVRPDGRRNFGELIEPQRSLPDLPSVNLSGRIGNLQSLRGQWLLVSVAGGACNAVCSRHLYLQRQLRESLGKDKDRLDWVWLIQDQEAVPEQLLSALKDATVLRVAPAGLSAWLMPARGHQLAEHVYLVDPLGNWMLRFPADLELSNAAKAKSDLDRLLRASATWDLAGRQPADQTGK
jgi:hypothetical protein